MSDISLSKAVRSNLLSLQSTAASMAMTQERLATGLKVNSALDNPTNFFTASALNSRAGDMANLLDSMSSGIKTIEAADNGLKSITKTVETMQSTLRQARQDKSFKTESYTIDLGATPAGTEQISFDGGAVGATAVGIDLTTNTAAVAVATGTTGNTGATFLDAVGIGLADADTFVIDDGTNSYTYTVTDASTETLQDLVNDINADTDLQVTASINADGALVLTADNNEAEIDVSGGDAISGITSPSYSRWA